MVTTFNKNWVRNINLLISYVTMEKLELQAPAKELVIEQVKLPSVPPKGLLIKITFSGICQSDLKLAGGSVDQGGSTKRLNYLDKIGKN